MPVPAYVQDLTGKIVNIWKILEFSHCTNGNSHWKVECIKCGFLRTSARQHLKCSKRCLRCYLSEQIFDFFGDVCNRSRRRSKQSNLSHNIDSKYIKKLWNNQDGRCAFSGRRLYLPRNKGTKTDASLDRKNSNIGYIKGNVQWVHKDVNIMKRCMTDAEFIAVCREVVAFVDSGGKC